LSAPPNTALELTGLQLTAQLSRQPALRNTHRHTAHLFTARNQPRSPLNANVNLYTLRDDARINWRTPTAATDAEHRVHVNCIKFCPVDIMEGNDHGHISVLYESDY
jgi:hypothetical protein